MTWTSEEPRTFRRLEPLHVFCAVFWVSGIGFVVAVQWPEGLGTVLSLAAWAVGGLVLFYLVAPAASVVVTPHWVIVHNPFRTYEVPRDLVEGVRESFWTPRLVVTGARDVPVGALNTNLPRGYPLGPGRHQRDGLRHLLVAVAPAPAGFDAEVRRRWRAGNLALALITLVLVVAATRHLVAAG